MTNFKKIGYMFFGMLLAMDIILLGKVNEADEKRSMLANNQKFIEITNLDNESKINDALNLKNELDVQTTLLEASLNDTRNQEILSEMIYESSKAPKTASIESLMQNLNVTKVDNNQIVIELDKTQNKIENIIDSNIDEFKEKILVSNNNDKDSSLITLVENEQVIIDTDDLYQEEESMVMYYILDDNDEKKATEEFCTSDNTNDLVLMQEESFNAPKKEIEYSEAFITFEDGSDNIVEDDETLIPLGIDEENNDVQYYEELTYLENGAVEVYFKKVYNNQGEIVEEEYNFVR